MKISAITWASSLAILVLGQTPPGFEPAVEANLAVIFGDKAVAEPGTSFTAAETAQLPTIGTTEALEGTYLLMVIDISVPATFTPGNYEPRRNMLHGLISGYTSSATPDADGLYVLKTAETGPAAYMGPAPPAETPPYAHSYVEVLFEQPEGWTAPATDYSGFNNRLGVEVGALIESLGVGEAVAANYFNVTGV